jgi:hypothetical protein
LLQRLLSPRSVEINLFFELSFKLAMADQGQDAIEKGRHKLGSRVQRVPEVPEATGRGGFGRRQARTFERCLAPRAMVLDLLGELSLEPPSIDPVPKRPDP